MADKKQIINLARQIAQEEGVDPELFTRLVNHESRFNPSARSPKGAIGLAQLMPDTARGLGVNPNDPLDNLRGGARYFKQQLQTFKSPALALAAYNAGPGAVKKYGGIPPFRETQNYVKSILGSSIEEPTAASPTKKNSFGAEMVSKKTEKRPERPQRPPDFGYLQKVEQFLEPGSEMEELTRLFQLAGLV